MGVGGDQFAMILSSWALYYQYTGDPEVLADMRNQADTYLANGLSAANAEWPNFPYPCNTSKLLAVYDGDLVAGKNCTQPDKAGSFGAELVTLYKITGERRYLEAARNIADTLAAKPPLETTSTHRCHSACAPTTARSKTHAPQIGPARFACSRISWRCRRATLRNTERQIG